MSGLADINIMNKLETSILLLEDGPAPDLLVSHGLKIHPNSKQNVCIDNFHAMPIPNDETCRLTDLYPQHWTELQPIIHLPMICQVVTTKEGSAKLLKPLTGLVLTS